MPCDRQCTAPSVKLSDTNGKMTTINILLILSGHLNKFFDMSILTHNHLFEPVLLGPLEDINYL